VRDLHQLARGFHLPWPALAGLFAASVALRIHPQFRREVHSVTLMELPLVLGLHFIHPTGLVLARLAGSVPNLVLHSRQRGAKLLFNIALFGLRQYPVDGPRLSCNPLRATRDRGSSACRSRPAGTRWSIW
jgi:hypothetical protein